MIKSEVKLHTAEIKSILRRCLENEISLRASLDKVAVVDGADSRITRIKKALAATSNDKQFIKLLNDLERNKSSLLLPISVVDT